MDNRPSACLALVHHKRSPKLRANSIRWCSVFERGEGVPDLNKLKLELEIRVSEPQLLKEEKELDSIGK